MAFSSLSTGIVYNGNGSDTTFAIPFSFQDSAEIFAELYDVSDPANPTLITPFDRGSEWDVAGTDVSTTAAPTTDQQLLIVRRSPTNRTTEYNTFEFPFDTANVDLDTIYRIAQENSQKLDRAILNDERGFFAGETGVTIEEIEALADSAAQVAQNTADIVALEARLTTAEGNITSLDGRLTTAESDIAALQMALVALDARVTVNEAGILANVSDIAALDTRVSALEAAPGSGPTIVLANAAGTVNAVANNVIIVRSTGVIIDLPATPNSGDTITAKFRSGGAVTVNGNGNTIDGQASRQLLSDEGANTFTYDSVEWVII